MLTRRSTALAACGAAALATALAAGVLAPAAHADDDNGYTFAVIGDIPYGATAIANFPKNVAQISADKDVKFVVHVGDIKNGSSVCSDAYFSLIRSDFDQFAQPLVYAPGDNEWTDCHRVNNGTYNPLERLAKIREVFFPVANRTLGQKTMPVKSQAKQGFIENVTWTRSDVAFVSVNLPGSNNSLLPWSGLGYKTATPEQVAESQTRTAADIALIKETFARAKEDGDVAVSVMLQADMFDPTLPVADREANLRAFEPVVKTLVAESAAFGKPVYLFNGDSHIYNVDKPLAAGSEWLAFYNLTSGADNLQRITVDGSGNAKDYLKVTIDDDNAAAPLSWTRVSYTN